jgi:hypothetical protein
MLEYMGPKILHSQEKPNTQEIDTREIPAELDRLEISTKELSSLIDKLYVRLCPILLEQDHPKCGEAIKENCKPNTNIGIRLSGIREIIDQQRNLTYSILDRLQI